MLPAGKAREPSMAITRVQLARRIVLVGKSKAVAMVEIICEERICVQTVYLLGVRTVGKVCKGAV